MQGNVRALKDKDGIKFYPVTHQSAIFYDDGESLEVKEQARVTAEDGRVTAESSRVTAESSRVTAETDRVTQFDVIKDGATLFDVLPVTTVRNSIELNPLGTYNYVSGNTVTANSLTTMESGQTDLNYAVTLQVSNEKVYSKTSYGFEVDKMIRDIILTQ